MLSKEELQRYHRQIIMPEMGMEGQEKLKKSRVLVIGAGGLGCPALQYLAAAGLGNIGIVDGDRVDESNLHRQILFNTEDIGKNKALVANEKLSVLNPFIQICHYPYFLTAENAIALIKEYDLVLDGSDNFATRYLVNDACLISGKPFVYAALHKFELQLSVFNFQNGPTYRCLFPAPPAAGETPSCAEAGILGALPGVAGTLQAVEALKILTGNGQPLSGKLLVMNLLDQQSTKIEFDAVAENRQISEIRVPEILCDTATATVPEVEIEELLDWIAEGKVQLIDVRDEHEFEEKPFGKKEINIPLAVLDFNLQLLEKGKTIVTICQSGVRSLRAASIIKEKHHNISVFSLKNGLNSLYYI